MISIKTIISRKRMKSNLKQRIRPIGDIIEEYQKSRDEFLKAERSGHPNKDYLKGRVDVLVWLLRLEK